MQIREIDDSRDRELENIVGNLMIAEYQVDKLRSKLTGRIGGYYHVHNIKTSAFAFKHNEKWYKVSIRVDEKYADDEMSGATAGSNMNNETAGINQSASTNRLARVPIIGKFFGGK